MLKGFSMRFVRDRRMIRFGRRWNTTHVASEVPAAHHHADENGMTALHWEAKKGCPDVVKSLIDAGADIEATGEGGHSPLLVACCKGKLSVVKMLVEAGASVCAINDNEDSCLTLAAHHGHTNIVRYLVGLPEVDVEHSNHPLNGFTTALNHAVLSGYSDMVQVLIDAGADIETTDLWENGPLFLASENGNLTIVKMLVKAGAKVCTRGEDTDTCLNIAARNGHTETVRYLVGVKDVDVNHRVWGGYAGLYGEDFSLCVTPLHGAALAGHTDVVQVLIDAGADVNAKDDNGRSPLHWASEYGRLAIVKMLSEAGASRVHGHTETEGNIYVVQVLIDAGVDIEAKDRMGRSPLHWACEGGNLAIVKMLVKAGAKVCATDNEANTCFTIAEKNGHTNIVRYLEKLRGVHVKQTDRLGNTALEAASEQGTATKEEVKALQEMMKSVMEPAEGDVGGTEGGGTTQR